MFLALRELKHSKARFSLIALIMILICLLVLFVSGLAKGLSSDIASSIQNLNTDYIVLQKDSDHRLNRSILTKDKIDKIKEQVNENDATPLGVQMTTVLKNGTDKKIDATFFAINVNDFLKPNVIEGQTISNETKNEVIADHSFKQHGIKLGDKIKDQVSGKIFTIVGFTKDEMFSHSPVIHINFKEWASIHKANTNFNALALKVNKDKATAVEKDVPGTEVISKAEALKGIPGYKEEQGTLIMMIVFLFVIAAFVLAAFFYVMTIQKINQFGVLKAIGTKSSYLARNIVSQVMVLTLLSLAISIGITYGMSALLPTSIPFDLSPQLVIGSALLFIVVSLLGSLLSLYRVAKVDALEAIGRAA